MTCHTDTCDSLVSNETDAMIKRYPREKILQDRPLREKLNRRLMQDMLTQALATEVYGKYHYYNTRIVMSTLSNIQPVTGDDRTIRYPVRSPGGSSFHPFAVVSTGIISWNTSPHATETNFLE